MGGDGEMDNEGDDDDDAVDPNRVSQRSGEHLTELVVNVCGRGRADDGTTGVLG
jgi:hypothetical protein